MLKILDELDAHARARKRVLTAEQAAEAVVLYQSGHSLMTVGMRLGVDAKTISRELARAGVQLRARPGWPSPAGQTVTLDH